MATDLQPATNPLDIPSPKPSEVVRNWPDKMWGQDYPRREYADGTITMCAEGILHELSGEPWGEGFIDEDGTRYWLLSSASCLFGLQIGQIARLQYINDRYGKEAAADVIQAWGL